MTNLIWFLAMLLSGLFLVLFIPILFEFNFFAGAVLGIIFFKIFLLSISCFRNHEKAEYWCDEASSSPLLNNNAQNIVTFPAHHLHNQFVGGKNF